MHLEVDSALVLMHSFCASANGALTSRRNVFTGETFAAYINITNSSPVQALSVTLQVSYENELLALRFNAIRTLYLS